MTERLPMLVEVERVNSLNVVLFFDRDMSDQHIAELQSLVSLKFAGQLRRDPNAPQTAPAQPGQDDAAAERSA